MEQHFNSAPSWYVAYGHQTYDDARKIERVWYYRDPASRAILRFGFSITCGPAVQQFGWWRGAYLIIRQRWSRRSSFPKRKIRFSHKSAMRFSWKARRWARRR